MRYAKLLLLATAITLLAACGGGGMFVPNLGPFTGTLLVGEDIIGAISLTTGSRTIGGTGTLTHNENSVSVSISGVVDGQTINGSISNANLGNGYFIGEFTDKDSCRGSFEYTDTLGFSTTTGTWLADIE